jgi:hypothetical protein
MYIGDNGNKKIQENGYHKSEVIGYFWDKIQCMALAILDRAHAHF